MLDCTAEFRLYWLHTKLAEEQQAAVRAASSSAAASGMPVDSGVGAMAVEVPAEGAACSSTGSSLPGITMEGENREEKHRLVPLSLHTCGPEGLLAAHSGPLPAPSFVRDGIYLLHKEGRYASGELSPLALLWKDAACSTYLLDTDAQGVALQQQQVVLEYRMDGTVATADDPPVVLGQLPSSFIQQMSQHLRPGRLLKFDIGEAGIYFHEGQPYGADLRYKGPGNQRRGRADQFTKIMYCTRRQPITLDQLMRSATCPACDSLAGEAAMMEDQQGS